MSVLFFNSCVCVPECSRQRDIHGTSISSLMYCKYYLFCAAYININIWVSEYPTHSSGPRQEARALRTRPVLDLGSGSNMRYPQSPDCRGKAAQQKGFAFCFRWRQNVQIVNREQGLLDQGRRCGSDYPPFFLSGMIESVIKSVYCYNKYQAQLRFERLSWVYKFLNIRGWAESYQTMRQENLASVNL